MRKSFFARIIIIASLPLLANANDLIRIEGADSKKLGKIQIAIEKAAYGPDGKTKDVVTGGSRATASEPDDACTAFWQPPAKLRLVKRTPVIDLCIGHGTAVLADTDTQIIFLCKNGKTVGDYDFSMGREGVGKTSLGDKKTPLGIYPLAKPYKSDRFKVFIPIGYPTPAQEKLGFTGQDAGIHGPARGFFRCAGFLNATVNWTQGCLAVSSDTFVKEIGRFVETNGIAEISILPLIPKP